MCWIFAFNWNENAVPLLINWLQNLEYRWYDSAWLFAINKTWDSYIEKAIWKVSNLASAVSKNNSSKTIFENWIAHTRWATHWKVTKENTHPHYSSNNRFYVVHNWIIENYIWIKNLLEKKFEFYSETDTEVITKLIEEYFDWNLQSTVENICEKLVWAYAIAVIDRENPEVLIWAKVWSPMIVW